MIALDRHGRTVLIALAALSLAACDGLSGGGDGTPIDIQVAHPNGVVFQTLSATVGREAVLVTVRVINGRDREIELNASRENSYLLTDSGEKLLLVPSPANEDLAIPAGQTIDVALVFAGELPRRQKATLVLNATGSTSSTASYNPKFQIIVPLDEATRGGSIPEISGMSGMRPNTASSLQPATGGGSTLGAAGQATSNLQTVEALKTELGAVQTDRGTVVSLPGDVTFDFDKATIRDSARGTLDTLAELILTGGDGQITIEGHTDSMGDDDYNKRLSEQRAAAVKAYLATKGVAEGRVRTIGLGELRPAAPNARPDGTDDEAGRQRNRRVEVILPNAPRAGEAAGSSASSLNPVP